MIRVAVGFRRGLAIFTDTWGVAGYYRVPSQDCVSILAGGMLTDAILYAVSRPFWGIFGDQDVRYSADRVAIQNGTAQTGAWIACVPPVVPFERTYQWDQIENCPGGHEQKLFSVWFRKPADAIVNLFLH